MGSRFSIYFVQDCSFQEPVRLKFSPHIRESMTWIRILFLGFQIPGTGFKSLSVELGFWISIVSKIPDSLSCIPDSRIHKPNFPGFWNSHSLTWGENSAITPPIYKNLLSTCMLCLIIPVIRASFVLIIVILLHKYVLVT